MNFKVYLKLRELLPSMITELAPEMNEQYNSEFVLYGVISSLSSIMPNVHVVNRNGCEIINLNYLRIRYEVDEDDDYAYVKYMREIFDKVRNVMTDLADDELKQKKPEASKIPVSMLYNFSFKNPRDFYQYLERLGKYGSLIISNHGTDFPATFGAYTIEGAQYETFRRILNEKWSYSDKDLQAWDNTMLPRITMVLSERFELMESLLYPKDKDLLSHFILTEPSETNEERSRKYFTPFVPNHFPETDGFADKMVDLFKTILDMNVQVHFTQHQADEFNPYFENVLKNTNDSDKGLVNRILDNYLHILFKLGTIFTIVRGYQNHNLTEKMNVCDDDFHAAFIIVKNSLRICLQRHEFNVEC